MFWFCKLVHCTFFWVYLWILWCEWFWNNSIWIYILKISELWRILTMVILCSLLIVVDAHKSLSSWPFSISFFLILFHIRILNCWNCISKIVRNNNLSLNIFVHFQIIKYPNRIYWKCTTIERYPYWTNLELMIFNEWQRLPSAEYLMWIFKMLKNQ